MKKYIYKLASGELVFDRPKSHLHGDILGLLKEALASIISEEREFFALEFDFGRIIGVNTCVPTTCRDDIVYAKRLNRAGYTRFVKDRRPEPCSSMAIVLKKDDEGNYILITAFVGHLSGPEPWDPRATDADRLFWGNHALLWGSEEIVPGSESSVYLPLAG